MKFTYNWLKKFLDTDLLPDQISSELTKIGLEVEDIQDRSDDLKNFIVAEIKETYKHPNADKLNICKVFDGKSDLQIVCGAKNVKPGLKIVLAPVNSIIPNGNFKIKSSKIRDVESHGMICSAQELSISGAIDDGCIIELDVNAIPGLMAIKYLGIDDVVYDVAVTPNRGDWLGVYGIARDLSARGLGKLKSLEEVVIEENFTSNFSASIESQDVYKLSFREIRNVGNIQSPNWLKNFLNLIGISPISFIVDITNYFSISFARPMHAYDASKLEGSKIFAKNLEKDFSFQALNEKIYKLENNDLVISDNNKPLALAGVIGGENSKYDYNTKNIILESAAFSKIKISEMGRKHGIITDSRSRFERGVDDERCTYFLNLATKMIVEIAGGESSNLILAENEQAIDRSIEFDYSIVKKRIGIEKSTDEMNKIISKLGFEIISSDELRANLKIPSWRHDINCKEVIAEEIARINGYDNIDIKNLDVENNLNRIQDISIKSSENLTRAIASLGYKECITYSFLNSNIAKEFTSLQDEMMIVNPITSDFNYMRPSIIPNLLIVMKNNFSRSLNNISLFENGPIFDKSLKSKEENTIAAIAEGNIFDKSHSNEGIKIDIYNVKSHLEYLISESGFQASKFQINSSTAPAYYHPGRSGSYVLGKNIIAYFGEIHPGILAKMDISKRVFAFELFIDRLPKSRQKFGRKNVLELSQYQKVTRDFAFLISKDIEAKNIIQNLTKADDLITQIDIFDVYEGDNLPKNMKSVALRASFQSNDKTLKERDIDLLSNKIISILREKIGAELRS